MVNQRSQKDGFLAVLTLFQKLSDELKRLEVQNLPDRNQQPRSRLRLIRLTLA